MSKLYITEYSEMLSVGNKAIPVPVEPGVEQTPITISGTSAQSAAFASSTLLVRIHSDVVCSLLFSDNPTADVNDKRMSAGDTEYFAITPGGKVAVISNT